MQAELARALLEGPGIVVFKRAFETPVVDAATAAFDRLIAGRRRRGRSLGDHFAKPGANDRVWGALDKLAVADPEVFAEYYANDVLALVSEAWLGPDYQVTSQVNVVNPGGQAQAAHRDYHLGFMDRTQAPAYPAQVHAFRPPSPCRARSRTRHARRDAARPCTCRTRSSTSPGYLAYHCPAFTEYFERALRATAAGQGRRRVLQPGPVPRRRHQPLQRHPPDGQPAPGVLRLRPGDGDRGPRPRCARAIYPVLLDGRQKAPARLLANVVAAAAEGYPFPTNLDLDQPVGGAGPAEQADLVHQALAEDWDDARLTEALAAQQTRRLSALG